MSGMLRSKNIDRICCLVIACTMLLAAGFTALAGAGVLESSRKTSLTYAKHLFDQSTVHKIEITMDGWDDFIDNCTDEKYRACAVIIDGEAQGTVGIRAKGNTSLSSMAQYENYSELPKNRCITLTDDGVVLSYDDSDAEYFVRDDGFAGGHTDPKEMRVRLGENVHLDFSYQYDSRDVVGTWGFWDGWQAVCLTFAENGNFSMFWKEPNKPIAVYEGVYGFGRSSGNLVVHAERLGHGGYPYAADWEWYVDDYGYINISDNDMVLMAGTYHFWPVEEDFFTVLDADTALGYIVANLTDSGEYTDQYGGEYTYYYSLPQFYHSENQDLQKINEQITAFYYPIMEEEQKAMEAGEILSYDLIDWQSSVYKGILCLHICAYAYDWEEHGIFYVDVDTLEQLDASEVLKRLEISEDEFLDAARTRAEEIFHYTFDKLPEEDREAYGYYDCLEQTVSDEFVNLDLPIFVDRHGEITVYLKISHMAGSGLMWQANNIFEEFYGEYIEEAVG